ncbi:MAG: DUF2232 domain-containing protein [Fretibacterium sp.]|nr:DUF2232 domain-containing protein [Fretibacterium sp.]
MTEPDHGPSRVPRPSLSRWVALTSLATLLFLGGVHIPHFGFWGILFCPTPLALLGLRQGGAWMTAGLGTVLLVVLTVMGPLWAAYFLFSEGLLCYALALPARWRPRAESSSARLTGGESLFICVGVSILIKLCLTGFFYIMTGANPLLPQVDPLRAVLKEMYPDIWGGEGSQALLLKEAIEEMLRVLPHMFPSLLVILAGLDSFVNYKLCEVLQRKRETSLPSLPPFRDWRFPKSLMWAMLLAFLLPLLFEELSDFSPLAVTAMNLKILVNIFFFLQGAALAWWFFHHFRVATVFKLLGLFLLSLPLFWPWLVFLGIGDIFFDVRVRLNRTGA